MKPLAIKSILTNPVLVRVAMAWPSAVAGGQVSYAKLAILTGYPDLMVLNAAAALQGFGAVNKFGNLAPELEQALLDQIKRKEKGDEAHLQQ